jgi:hypothetical protein
MMHKNVAKSQHGRLCELLAGTVWMAKSHEYMHFFARYAVVESPRRVAKTLAVFPQQVYNPDGQL